MQIGFASDQAARLKQALDHSRIALGPGSEQGPSATTGGQIGGVDVVLDGHRYARQREMFRWCTRGLIEGLGLQDQAFRIAADPGIQRGQPFGLRKQGLDVLQVPELSRAQRCGRFQQREFEGVHKASSIKNG